MRQGGLALGGDPRQPVGAHRRSKGGAKGYDAGKKITGRKRHIMTDTDGRLLSVRVHGADIQTATAASRRSRPRAGATRSSPASSPMVAMPDGL